MSIGAELQVGEMKKVLEMEKSKVKVLEDLVSGESLFPDLYVATFLLYCLMDFHVPPSSPFVL